MLFIVVILIVRCILMYLIKKRIYLVILADSFKKFNSYKAKIEKRFGVKYR